MNVSIEALAEQIAKTHRLETVPDPKHSGWMVQCPACGWTRVPPPWVRESVLTLHEQQVALDGWVAQMQRVHGAFEALRTQADLGTVAYAASQTRPIPDMRDGTGTATRRRIDLRWTAATAASAAHEESALLLSTGDLTFADALVDAVCEVLASSDTARLRITLIQVSEGIEDWLECLRRREAKP